VTTHLQTNRKSKGFSLIEIMVGMIIGLLGILVIMQVYATSEARKKTTTSGGDAQTNGAIGLFNLQREVQLAGYGVSSTELLGCNVQLRGGVSLSDIAPVTINHASIPSGDANTDTLLIVYGNANGAAEGDTITQNTIGTIYTVQSPDSFVQSDYVIAQFQSRASPCTLTLDLVTNDPITDRQVVVQNGALVGRGLLFNLGQTPRIRAYVVRNGNLTVCEYTQYDCSDATKIGDGSVWVPIVNNIVSLRAEYGRDTNIGPMDGIVDTYDQTIATTSTTPAVSSVQCGWIRASAIRLALVARSGQKEASSATTTAPTWAGNADFPIDLSGDGDWEKYRYKKFETTVPLKNISWQKVVSGC